MRKLSLLSFVVCLIAASANAAATLGQIDFGMTVDGQDVWSWTTTRTGVPVGGDAFTVPNGTFTPDGYPDSYTITWSNVSFDTDPQVAGVWAVTNNSAVTQIFTLSITVPVVAIPGGTLMFGSSSLTLADANFSGSATLASVGADPLYAGQIDFSNQLPLFANPYSQTVLLPPGTYSETAFAGAFPGSIPGAAVVGTIGIQHRFSLTAGDSATFNSLFSVVAPEPGTGLLMAMGLGVLAARRR